MQMQAYVDEIKLHLTGGVLQLEIDDATIMKIINSAFREVQRYIDSTKLETVPFQRCIDCGKALSSKVSSVVRIYRAEGFVNAESNSDSSVQDPMLVQQWQLLSGNGNILSMQDYTLNYAAWSTSQQVRNTLSTDLAFFYDKSSNLLYINVSSGTPTGITIEYVPRYESVDQINSDFWIDVLMKLSIAKAKIAIGRIRTRFSSSNALWAQDGEKLLEEGNAELSAIEEKLLNSSQLIYGID